MRDHEAAIEACVFRQKRWQARDAAVDQHGNAPLGNRAHFGNRQRNAVRGQGHRLGVEVAAREHGAIIGKHQRVVGDRIGLAQQHDGAVAQLVQAGAHHLRLAAQAIGVLHAVIAIEVRQANSAAF